MGAGGTAGMETVCTLRNTIQIRFNQVLWGFYYIIDAYVLHLPPCTNRGGREGILDSYPNLKLATTSRHRGQSLFGGSYYAGDLFFASWPL